MLLTERIILLYAHGVCDIDVDVRESNLYTTCRVYHRISALVIIRCMLLFRFVGIRFS